MPVDLSNSIRNFMLLRIGKSRIFGRINLDNNVHLSLFGRPHRRVPHIKQRPCKFNALCAHCLAFTTQKKRPALKKINRIFPALGKINGELHINRINIDTGAFRTGILTALVIEEESSRFLQATAEGLVSRIE